MLGGGHSQADAKQFKVATINVTALKAKRQEDILAHKELQDAEVLLVQEVRLHSSKPSWVRNIALKLGWRVLCSEPPERCENGMVKQGAPPSSGSPPLARLGQSEATATDMLPYDPTWEPFGLAMDPQVRHQDLGSRKPWTGLRSSPKTQPQDGPLVEISTGDVAIQNISMNISSCAR